jgi:hypothetical protein
MRPQDWDPKTFFAMHDLNGDKFWDEDEVRVSSSRTHAFLYVFFFLYGPPRVPRCCRPFGEVRPLR